MRPQTTGVATVAFVHRGHDWIRGSEQCLLDLASRLDRGRFRPLVICTAPTLAREAERLGVPAHQVPSWETAMLAPTPVRQRMAQLLREHRVDLVHANMTTVVPSVLLAARAMRVPVVAHLHLPQNDEYWRLRELVHQTDMAVGVAEHVVRELREDGMPAERIRVIHNAVDATRLSAGDASGLRASLGIPREALVAVSIGSLIRRKGHDVTIRALAQVRARGHDVRLLVCGDGEEADSLRALAGELQVTEAVHFLGYRSDVGAVARDAADISVTSSREEALSLNVLEAQSLGLPLVASDIAGHREGMAPGESGVLVPAEDPSALADALAALAESPSYRARLGSAGKAFVAERFSMERYVGEFASLYEELLARPRSTYGWARAARWVPAYLDWAQGIVRRRLGLPR